jgi:3-(3-hydroxy-phenyl)propionate hydroxylase
MRLRRAHRRLSQIPQGAGILDALSLIGAARFGVASILLDEDLQVSHGSRAIVLTRRSMEILQQLGVAKPFREKGLPWSFGRSFAGQGDLPDGHTASTA